MAGRRRRGSLERAEPGGRSEGNGALEIIDLEAERGRIRKEVERAQQELEKIEKKLSNEAFVAKAPGPAKIASAQQNCKPLCRPAEAARGFSKRLSAAQVTERQFPAGLPRETATT